MEENDDVTFAIKQVTMQGNALIEGTLTRMTIKIPLMAIKGMANLIAKVKGVLEIKEEDNHSRRLEIPGMNLTLLTINRMNIIYQLLYLPLLLQTRWEIGLLIVTCFIANVTSSFSSTLRSSLLFYLVPELFLFLA